MNQVSSITFGEWVKLRSTLYALDNKQFQCSWCIKQFRGRTDEQAMLQRVRDRMACSEVRDITLHTIRDAEGKTELQYSTCIGNHYDSSCIFWIEAAARYDQGVLPFAGPMTNQPNKVMEIFATISAYKQDKLLRQQKADKLRGR